MYIDVTYCLRILNGWSSSGRLTPCVKCYWRWQPSTLASFLNILSLSTNRRKIMDVEWEQLVTLRSSSSSAILRVSLFCLTPSLYSNDQHNGRHTTNERKETTTRRLEKERREREKKKEICQLDRERELEETGECYMLGWCRRIDASIFLFFSWSPDDYFPWFFIVISCAQDARFRARHGCWQCVGQHIIKTSILLYIRWYAAARLFSLDTG